MVWLRTWQLGVKSLLLHPLRSGLTMLGILIGVWAVIVLTAISQGASDVVQKQIESLGANTIIVRSIKPPAEKLTGRAAQYGLKRSDLELIIANVPTIESALPIREIRRQFTVGDNSVDGRLVGCTPEYAEVNRLTIREGRFLADADDLTADTVCVLAAQTADRLFPFEDPLGKRIYIPESSDYYRVVGVLNAPQCVGGNRWFARFARLFERRLHPDQNAATQDRRYGNDSPQRSVRNRNHGTESDYLAGRCTR